MSQITLSAGVRSNLLSLQNTASLMEQTQTRLATGKKVNSALDNPTNFFTSQSLQARSGELSGLLDAMSNGIKTLEAADNGITAMTKTIESMQALVTQARADAGDDGDEGDVREQLREQFNDLRTQLDDLAKDASFNGMNLLVGDELVVRFNETGDSSIKIQTFIEDDGEFGITAGSLGIDDQTDWGDAEDLDTLLGGLRDALTTLRSQATAFGTSLSTVQNRQDFTKSMMNTLQTGADNLVLADTNEEGANMLALQTRQQLSSVALSLASQADQAVLRLF